MSSGIPRGHACTMRSAIDIPLPHIAGEGDDPDVVQALHGLVLLVGSYQGAPPPGGDRVETTIEEGFPGALRAATFSAIHALISDLSQRTVRGASATLEGNAPVSIIW
jgi:hypothetical protein